MQNEQEGACNDNGQRVGHVNERRRSGWRGLSNAHLIAIARDPSLRRVPLPRRQNSMLPVTLVAVAFWSGMGLIYLHV